MILEVRKAPPDDRSTNNVRPFYFKGIAVEPLGVVVSTAALVNDAKKFDVN